MKLENLVDGERLKKLIRDQIIAETEWDADATEIPFGDIKRFMKSCTLSPAQLAEENLKAWAVLEELKKWIIKERKRLIGDAPNSRHWLGLFELHIQNLESQTPPTAEEEKKDDES